MKILNIVMICFMLLLSNLTYANDADSNKEQELNSWEHLDTLVTLINSMSERLSELRGSLEATENSVKDKQIVSEIEQVSQDLKSLQAALEMLATGGADLSLFGEKTTEKFDWREQLQSVFEPILVELRRLSERPRKIERLRSDLEYYSERLAVAKSAVENLTRYRENAPTDHLKKAFSRIEERWQRRQVDLQNRVNLVNFELQETLSPTNAPKTDPVESLKKLLGGRVLNLAMAVAVMAAVYGILKLIANGYKSYISRKSKRRRAFVARAGILAFYLLTTLIVLLSGMAVFYIRGDWVLMGLVFIMLAGAAWAIQKSLPQYLIEAKLILNLGPVREGERIMFNDLPWRVDSLSFQAKLHNPELQGGALYLPVKSLVDYNSRRYDESELWFPTRTGDWALLEDDTYGQVISQSPEFVELKVLSTIKTYRSTAFIDLSPRNLSMQGFTLLLTVGLDYKHQADITTIIVLELQSLLEAGFKESAYGESVKSVQVMFDKANASSLDLVTKISFDGRVADKYFELPRLFQSLTVEACNKNDWVIPFDQLTIHTVDNELNLNKT